MKAYMKIDLIFIVYPIIIILIPTGILSLSNPNLFNFKQALLFSTTLLAPLLFVVMVFIFTTSITIENENLNINYFSIFKKSLKIKEIDLIKNTKKGFNLLALSNEKILIKHQDRNYIFSFKDKKLLIEKLKDINNNIDIE
jgi:hypothetical protein